jgi:drug/metabolite transporter (DMT)-like permease
MNPTYMRAIVMMVVAVFSFTVLDAIAKYLTQFYPVMFVVWVRYAAHSAIMLAILAPQMGWKLVASKRPKVQLLRGFSLIGSTMFFFSALSILPLADAQSVALLAPILVTLAANRWLGEPLPKQTWWILAISFCGVLLVIKPGTSVFSPATILALGSAVCFAIYQLTTRMVAQVDNNMATLFMGAAVGTVMMSAALPWVWQLPQTLTHGFLFVAMGVIGGAGHLLMVHAFERAPASRLAPFVYLQIVSGLVLGYAVFGHFPDSWALLGMAMIALTGIANGLIRDKA